MITPIISIAKNHFNWQFYKHITLDLLPCTRGSTPVQLVLPFTESMINVKGLQQNKFTRHSITIVFFLFYIFSKENLFTCHWSIACRPVIKSKRKLFQVEINLELGTSQTKNYYADWYEDECKEKTVCWRPRLRLRFIKRPLLCKPIIRLRNTMQYKI